MSEPLISVILPAYNHERYVGAAIEGVLNQTFTDWELVIVDDGSTDRTAEVIKGYKDPRINYHYQENQDAFNALNRGMALARGTWFSILNSDDCYHPDRLQVCLDAAESGADAVFTGVSAIDEQGAPIPEEGNYWVVWHQRNRAHYKATGDLYAGFLRGNLMITTSNLFMRAETARHVGGFAALRYLHDYDYIFRLLLACPGRVRYLDDQRLVYYRFHGKNTLKQGAVVAREQDLDLIRKYTLLGIPAEHRARVETGLERSAELYHEMEQVKRQLRWGRWRPWVDAFCIARARVRHALHQRTTRAST